MVRVQLARERRGLAAWGCFPRALAVLGSPGLECSLGGGGRGRAVVAEQMQLGVKGNGLLTKEDVPKEGRQLREGCEP